MATIDATTPVSVPPLSTLEELGERRQRLVNKRNRTISNLCKQHLEDSAKSLERQETKMLSLQQELRQIKLHDDASLEEAKKQRYMGWFLGGFALFIGAYEVGITGGNFALTSGEERKGGFLILSSGYLVVAVLGLVAVILEGLYHKYKKKESELHKLTDADIQDTAAILKVIRKWQKLERTVNDPENSDPTPELQECFNRLNQIDPKTFEDSLSREELASGFIQTLPDTHELKRDLKRAVDIVNSHEIPEDFQIQLSDSQLGIGEADQQSQDEFRIDILNDSPRPELWRVAANQILAKVQSQVGGIPLEYFKYGNVKIDPYGNLL